MALPSVLVIARSALGAGVSESVAELFPGVGSLVVVEIVAVLSRLVVRLEATFKTIVKTCDAAPATRVGRVAVMVPLAPIAVLSVRVQPAGTVMEFKVVPVGRMSLNVNPCASLGPLVLLTVMV